MFKTISTLNITSFANALTKLDSQGFSGLLTSIPKLIASIKILGVSEFTAMVQTQGLTAALQALNINPVVLAFSALIAVVGIGVAVYNHFTTSLKEHQQMLDDAKSSYKDTAAQIDSLNTKLSDTKSKISELEGYNTLSFTDQQELDKLKAQNDELQREIDLQKQLADAKQQDVNKQFADTMSADVGKTGEYQSSFRKEFIGNTGGVAQYRAENINEMQYASEQVEVYKSTVEKYEKYQAELEKAKADGNKKAEELAQKQVDIYKKQSDESQKYLDQRIADLVSASEGVTEDASTKPYLDFINNLRDQWSITYNEMSGNTEAWSQSQTDAFNRVANSADFSSLIKDAEKAGSNLDLTQEKYKDFVQALVDSGFIENDSSENLKKVADAINDIGESVSDSNVRELGTASFSSLVESLSTAKDSLSTLNSAFGDLKDNGYVAFGTLTDIENKFSDVSGIDKYINALASANGNTKKTNQILSQLAEHVVRAKIGTDNLASADESLVASMLKEAGVANSTEAAHRMVSTAKIKLKVESYNLATATDAEKESLINEAKQLGLTEIAISQLTNAFSDAQTAMSTVMASGATARLGIAKTELEGIKTVAQAYELISQKSSMTSTEIARHKNSKDLSGVTSQNTDDMSSILGYASLIEQIQTTIDNLGSDTGLGTGDLFKFSGNASKDKDETEIYLSDIDKLYSGKEKLAEIQHKIERLSSINEVTDSDVEKVQNLNQIIILYKQEQDALHALNQERKNVIAGQVSTLRSQGFDVLYDPNENKLVINNLEHLNKLQGKTTDKTIEIRKAAEKLISTVQSENDDAIQTSQDWLNVLKDINGAYDNIKQSAEDALKEAQQGLEDNINSIKSTVDKAFDEISKLLDKERESYETQKSNLESVASTVTSYINDYISGLQEQNDELDKQISLQEKLEALDKAKTQRNKRIFKSGSGFVWSADQSAVSSAQEEYDSALREYNLNERIQELKDYSQAWQNAVNSYETSANEALTASILGSNWKSKILGTNYSTVKNFKADYTDVLRELDEGVYGSVAYQIKNLDDLKDSWDDSVDRAEDTSTDYKTVLDLIHSYESGNYSTRLTELSKFVTSMKAQYQELSSAAQLVTNALPTATTGYVQYDANENYAQKILNSATLSEAQAYAALRDAKIAGENITGVASTQSFLDQWKPSSSSYSNSSKSSGGNAGTKASSVAKTVVSAIGSVVSSISKNLLGFSEGGVVSDTGIAMLHGGNGHNEVVLNSNSADNVWKYIQSGDALANSAAMLMMANKIPSSNSPISSSAQHPSFSIGNIYVSGVNNVDELVSAIKTELPTKMLQSFYRR